MKKNYRKGIMKIDNAVDEVAKFKTESMEEISRLPYFEKTAESTDNIVSAENDGVENSNVNQ